MPVVDGSCNIILVLIIIATLGLVASRYWYLPRKNGDNTHPLVRKN
ncbi:MAG: hypothetical protein WCF90_09950 [Methanomicrobiales archaeon]